MTAARAGARTDEDIKLDIITSLRWDDRVDVSRVMAQVADGRVTLRGEVKNYTSRAAAVEQSWFTSGVVDVVDNLTVEVRRNIPGGDDKDLASRANNIIDWQSDLAESDIRVVAREGTLELEGSVDAHWKSERARDLVMGIHGVTGVRNNLAVVPTHDIADEALAREITAALERNVLVNEDRVEVEVVDGVVTLHGWVVSWLESNTVENVVSATPGSLGIRNQLKLDTEKARS